MKEFFRGKKTYISIALIVISLALQHFAKIHVTSDELQALVDSGAEVVEIGQTELWPTLLGLWASIMAIWARRRTDIELEEELIEEGIIAPKALDPKTGQPFKAGLFAVALLCVISLPSCSSNLLDGSSEALENGSVGVLVGQANVIGAEFVIGPYRPGLAFTFRYVQPVGSVPPPPEPPLEISYPLNEK